MAKIPILLLKPEGSEPSPEDQTEGACLAALRGPISDQIILQKESFPSGDMDALDRVVTRWKGRVTGVVGATDVSDSAHLGELAEEHRLLCFVSNNNPVVWQHRRHVFHIGVPTAMIGKATAARITQDIGAQRVFILYDITEFQTKLASSVAACLQNSGAAVQAQPGGQEGSIESTIRFRPELVYLAYTNEALILPFLRELRRLLPDVSLLVGMSLLRSRFVAQIPDERISFVDLFHRIKPTRKQEGTFMKTLQDAGVQIPAPNHGFGWDAISLCANALVAVNGDVSSAIETLESNGRLEGATGYFEFGSDDHNGRAVFNPVLISRQQRGRIMSYEEEQ